MPKYVILLKNAQDKAGVVDMVNRLPDILYFQTIREKPPAFGYITRVPKSGIEKDKIISELLKKRDFESLHGNYNLRYLIVDSKVKLPFKVFCRSKG